MADPRGLLKVKANGEEYTLSMGMSVIADLQAKHGLDVLGRLDRPEGAGPEWFPDLNIAVDLFILALERYHSDVADKWLVDDIVSQNEDLLNRLLNASSPEAAKDAKPGNRKRPTRAA